eukprot:8528794-Prorocentrum_lima.AAC.1
MTSSLVGSEMCIRDSSFTVDGKAVNMMHTQAHLQELVGQRLATWQHEIAVSYTHLTLPTICSV